MHRFTYLALGTNLGDRLENLRSAIKALSPDIKVLSESKIYETSPWGYQDQPDFLNMAVKCGTDLEPDALLKRLKQLEVQIGRERSFHWGPRLIDLDIIFYDNIIISSESLTIPHPRLPERAFVLAPLSDIAPAFVHPVLGKTVQQMLDECDATGVRPYL